MKMAKRVLTINAHCQDRFTASVTDDGKCMEYGPDYVPRELGIGGGDYLELRIDIDTGQILDWKPIDKNKLRDILKGRDEDDGEE